MFSIVQAAGWPIWLIIISSIIALALIIERFIALQKNKVLPPRMLEEVTQVYRAGKVTPKTLSDLSQSSPLGRVLCAGLKHVNSSRELMKESIEEAGRAAEHDLERFLMPLGTIASLAPLMGLFGTVIGMIEIFGATNGTGSDPAQLGHGISIALYNTAFGLAVAIPALIFYRYFRGLVDAFIVEMEQQAIRFVEIVHQERKN